jgi:hypothetical protein
MFTITHPAGRARAPRPVPKAARAETIRQAERWEINKNRALECGLCDACGGQYAWGLADGFAIVHPPCQSCSAVVERAIGAVKPNGWRVLWALPLTPPTLLTRERSGGPQSRHIPPAMGRDGHGSCRGCGDHWTGLAVCHCSTCDQTFADITAFDRHRVRGHCQDPATRGLIKIHRKHWTGWSWPTATGATS